MRPDPGRDLLEARMAELTRDERALISMELRARGFASVWDQLDRSGITDPVEQVMFLIGRLYPEMPAVHVEQLRRQFAERHAAGTWHGPERPAPIAPHAGRRSG
jgi:hypothetical protein